LLWAGISLDDKFVGKKAGLRSVGRSAKQLTLASTPFGLLPMPEDMSKIAEYHFS
jgi:hypothetical protein